ncbi:MAG: phage holin family protein [Patescibacteria group bacterium]
MINRIILKSIAGILGIYVAVHFVPGVALQLIPGSEIFGIQLTEKWHVFVLVGTFLGLINTFIKPILSAITTPIRILTLGLFGLVINMAMIWAIDVVFPELTIAGLTPLFWTTMVVWGINLFVGHKD